MCQGFNTEDTKGIFDARAETFLIKRSACTAAAPTAFARACITQLLSSEEHLLRGTGLGSTMGRDTNALFSAIDQGPI